MQKMKFKIVREFKPTSGDYYFQVYINDEHKKSVYFKIDAPEGSACNEDKARKEAIDFVTRLETWAKNGIQECKETVYESEIDTEIEKLPF